jgi:hypothetical protein
MYSVFADVYFGFSVFCGMNMREREGHGRVGGSSSPFIFETEFSNKIS